MAEKYEPKKFGDIRPTKSKSGYFFLCVQKAMTNKSYMYVGAARLSIMSPNKL